MYPEPLWLCQVGEHPPCHPDPIAPEALRVEDDAVAGQRARGIGRVECAVELLEHGSERGGELLGPHGLPEPDERLGLRGTPQDNADRDGHQRHACALRDPFGPGMQGREAPPGPQLALGEDAKTHRLVESGADGKIVLVP